MSRYRERIAGSRTRLMEGLRRILSDAGVTATVTVFPQVFHVALGLESPARDYRDLLRMNRPAYVSLASELLYHGVHVLERGAWFLSSEHGTDVIDETLDVADNYLTELCRETLSSLLASLHEIDVRDGDDSDRRRCPRVPERPAHGGLARARAEAALELWRGVQ